MIKAVIFNMTGVICDPAQYIHEARKVYLKERGANYTKEEIEKTLGLALRDQIKIYNKNYNLNLDYDDFSKKTAEMAKEMMKGKLKANPGVKELIKDLKDNKIKIAIASQNLKENILDYLKFIGMPTYFDAITSVEELTRFKPDPQLYEITCEKLRIKPSECVMIDDSVFGFEPAKKLGIKTIGIASTFQKKENLQKVADLVIDSLEELNVEKIRSL